MSSSHKHTKDYSRNTRSAAVALIVVLIVVSFIPPQSIGSIELRRANILSDLVTFDDARERQALPDWDKEEDFYTDFSLLAEEVGDVGETARSEVRAGVGTDFATPPAAPAFPTLSVSSATSSASQVQTLFEWRVDADPAAAHSDDGERMPTLPDTFRPSGPVIPIEPFDSLRDDCFAAFCAKLLAARQPVRIAVLGDSFIEGDILTADLRERLQETYGGGGTGFAPMASPLTAFRRTVKTTAKGWTSYNIMQRKKTPEHLRDKFYVSGWVCQPSAGASTRWEATTYRHKADECTCGRIFFLAADSCRLEVTVNDSLHHEFTVEGDPSVRQIAVRAPRIGSLSLRVAEGAGGFIGYGAVLESDGLSVDNYSIRSNNGQAMFWTNPSIDAQVDAMLDYDLVVLQYGLNIMRGGVHNYTNYAAQIEKMVTFVRECFPGAAVLVMGVSDRSVRTDAGFVPMSAVRSMTAYQRQAARSVQAAFWPTADAMADLGGMSHFVRSGWAGKDHTHINYAGGRRIGHALFDALNDRIRAVYEVRRREIRYEPVQLDSLRRRQIERRLFIGPAPLKPTTQP